MSRTDSAGGHHARSIAPIVGVLALLALTVCLGAVVAVSVGSFDVADDTATVSLSASAEGATDEISVTHRYGDPVAVTDIDLVVTIEGEDLTTQPPVPFFAADGFRGGPTGPFNARADPTWRVGQTGSFRIASTNEPTIESGDEVVVTIRKDGERIARVETTAE